MLKTFLICTLLSTSLTFANELSYPLLAPSKISGSFGEYRPYSLHRGVDMRTFAVSGVPVVAMSNGFVEKLHGSNLNSGFGRALYLRHRDSKMSVYGHLHSLSQNNNLWFAWNLFAKYSANGNFMITLPENQFPVKGSEIIAYSGDAGIGPYHLHYELIDEKGQYVNPIGQDYLRYGDREPPILQKLYIYTPGAAMTSKKRTLQNCELHKREANQYACDDVIPVDDSVCFRLTAYDQSLAINRLGLTSLRVEMNDKTIYWADMRQMSRAQGSLHYRFYDTNRSSLSPVVYTHHACWPDQSADADSHAGWVIHEENNGWIKTDDWALNEKKTVNIIAGDAEGNLSRLSVVLQKANGSKPSYTASAGYNLAARKSHSKKSGSLTVSTGRLKKPANLAIISKPGSVKGMNIVGKGWQIRWRSAGWEYFKIFVAAPFRKHRGLILNGKWLNAEYSSSRGGYTAWSKRAGNLYLADDISSPQISLPYAYGPLAQREFDIRAFDSGSGVDDNGLELMLNGILLSEKDLLHWGVRFDKDRNAFILPTGILPGDKTEVHHLKTRVKDRSGNFSSWVSSWLYLKG